MFGWDDDIRGSLVAWLDGAIDSWIKPALGAVVEGVKGVASTVQNAVADGADWVQDKVGMADKSESPGMEQSRGIGLSATRGPNLPEQGGGELTEVAVDEPTQAAYAQIDGLNIKDCLGQSGVVCETQQSVGTMDVGNLAAPTAVNFAQHQQQVAQGAGIGV